MVLQARSGDNPARQIVQGSSRDKELSWRSVDQTTLYVSLRQDGYDPVNKHDSPPLFFSYNNTNSFKMRRWTGRTSWQLCLPRCCPPWDCKTLINIKASLFNSLCSCATGRDCSVPILAFCLPRKSNPFLRLLSFVSLCPMLGIHCFESVGFLSR